MSLEAVPDSLTDFKPNYDCKTIWGGFISELLQITSKTAKGIFYVPWSFYLHDSLTDVSVGFKLNQTYWGVFISEQLQTNIKNCKGNLLCPLRLLPHSLSDVSVVKLQDKLRYLYLWAATNKHPDNFHDIIHENCKGIFYVLWGFYLHAWRPHRC